MATKYGAGCPWKVISLCNLYPHGVSHLAFNVELETRTSVFNCESDPQGCQAILQMRYICGRCGQAELELSSTGQRNATHAGGAAPRPPVAAHSGAVQSRTEALAFKTSLERRSEVWYVSVRRAYTAAHAHPYRGQDVLPGPRYFSEIA